MRRLAAIALAIGTGSALPAGAQPDLQAAAAPSERLAALIDSLDAPQWSARESATLELIELASVRLVSLEPALRVGELSPEQRARLLRVAAFKFTNEPRAAIGITRGPVQQGPVSVLEVRREFPASDVLKEGDLLVALDGERLRDFTDLRRIILSHDPGDVIPVELIRDTQPMKVSVELGSFNTLRADAGGLMDSELRVAWEHRSRSYADPGKSAPIDSGLSGESWLDRTPAYRTITRRSTLPDQEMVILPTVTPGGEPRGGMNPSRDAWAFTAGAQARALDAPLVRPRVPGVPVEAARMQLDLRVRARDMMKLSLEEERRRLSDPAIPASTRRALEVRLAIMEREIEQFDAEIRALRESIDALEPRK